LSLSGPRTGTTTADGTGRYTFTGLPAGIYVVSASQAGYAFSPSLATVTLTAASVSGVNFTATPAPVAHSVSLNWGPGASSSGVRGFNVYRTSVSGGGYVKVNSSLLTIPSFVDNSVVAGATYYYVATQLDSNNIESEYSNQTTARIPTP
jgi:fibronectin type 3 domain-containing protein